MKIVVTGGGTGGHIYPALAFIDYVKQIQPDTEFLYIGAKRGLENKILPQTDIPFKTLEIQGFKRSISLENIKTVQLFLKSVKQGKKILKTFQPDIVIGTGGYVSGAMVYAAHRLGIKTVIHEQNSVPGITNKFLARFVDGIAISFKDVASYFPKANVRLTGNPRAQQVSQIKPSDILQDFSLSPNKKTVLIFGGSQGARKINEVMLQALDAFKEKPYQVLYATGERYFKTFEKKVIPSNVTVVPYIQKMNELLANIDLLVGRAGATSIAEFTALGIPAVLIPSPYVTNDHQTKNATSLVQEKAAEMIKDEDLTKETLVSVLDRLLKNDETLQQMKEASKKQGYPDASKRLYDFIQEL